MSRFKYKYSIKIHKVEDIKDLENVMNDYGSNGIRVIKAEYMDSKIIDSKHYFRYILHLEEKKKCIRSPI